MRYTPAAFIYKPPALATASRLTYVPRDLARDPKISEEVFKKLQDEHHIQREKFEKDFLAVMSVLANWMDVPAHLVETPTEKETLETPYDLFIEHFLNPRDWADRQPSAFFEIMCGILSHLAAQLQSSPSILSDKTWQSILFDLGQQIGACAPGAFSAIQTAYNRITHQENWQYWLAAYRRSLIEQFASQHITRLRKNGGFYTGNEIHVSNTLLQWAALNGLNPLGSADMAAIIEQYAETARLRTSNYDACRQYFEAKYDLFNMANCLTDQILKQIEQFRSEHKDNEWLAITEIAEFLKNSLGISIQPHDIANINEESGEIKLKDRENLQKILIYYSRVTLLREKCFDAEIKSIPIKDGVTLYCAITPPKILQELWIEEGTGPGTKIRDLNAWLEESENHHALLLSLLTPHADVEKALIGDRALQTAIQTLLETHHIDQKSDADKYGKTPLHYTAQFGDVVLTEALIRTGAAVNRPTKRGGTALFLATRKGHEAAAAALIQAGAAIDQATHFGETPLHAAACYNRIGILKNLIQSGANINQVDNDDTTALFMAASNGHVDAVKVLMDAGADINKPVRVGTTPLYIAALQGHTAVVALLKQAGAKISDQESCLTHLHTAAAQSQTEIVRALLTAGVKPDAEDQTGLIPLHHAARAGHTEIVDMLMAASSSGHWLKSRSKDNLDYTALHFAAQNGHTATVKRLLQAPSAFIFVNRKTGKKTTLDLALENKHWNTAHAILASDSPDRLKFSFPIRKIQDKTVQELFQLYCKTRTMRSASQFSEGPHACQSILKATKHFFQTPPSQLAEKLVAFKKFYALVNGLHTILSGYTPRADLGLADYTARSASANKLLVAINTASNDFTQGKAVDEIIKILLAAAIAEQKAVLASHRNKQGFRKIIAEYVTRSRLERGIDHAVQAFYKAYPEFKPSVQSPVNSGNRHSFFKPHNPGAAPADRKSAEAPVLAAVAACDPTLPKSPISR